MVISALYSPPRHAIKKEQYEEFFKALGARFIADEDFNAEHPLRGSPTINPKGRKLIKAFRQKICCMFQRVNQHIGRPTQTNFRTL